MWHRVARGITSQRYGTAFTFWAHAALFGECNPEWSLMCS